ncbi:MAG: single-stranded DNA-binding protein [Chitinophagaceae bacterium]|jgi:single-strand DNA-binding protein|nr:single-stranded DNA-binding protein [Chitinophagaceae bacterium]
MNALKNRVQLIGNLGLDPEVKEMNNGRKMARLRMATHESYTNAKGERVTETQWHNVIAWGKTADIAARYLAKGLEVAVEGKLVNRSYVTGQGEKKQQAEIMASSILILTPKAASVA